MEKLNVTQAAKALGISKTTLYKHAAEGRVSFELDDRSKKTFDPAELARAYPDQFKVERLDAFSGRSVVSPKTAQNVHMGQDKDLRIKELEDQVKDLKNDRADRNDDAPFSNLSAGLSGVTISGVSTPMSLPLVGSSLY